VLIAIGADLLAYLRARHTPEGPGVKGLGEATGGQWTLAARPDCPEVLPRLVGGD
jgi:hypothetical protein